MIRHKFTEIAKQARMNFARTGLFICLIFMPVLAGAAAPSGCLSSEEQKLASLINDYRKANRLPAVTVSRSLTSVSQWHTIDLKENSPAGGACNNHSWSGARNDLWNAVCYTDDHANAAGMWYKPREITNGAYTDNGFENVYWHSSAATAQGAFVGWQNSLGHRETILEQGIWNGMQWQSMGIGIYKNYAALWFGQAPDPQGSVVNCSGGGGASDNTDSILIPIMELVLSSES